MGQPNLALFFWFQPVFVRLRLIIPYMTSCNDGGGGFLNCSNSNLDTRTRLSIAPSSLKTASRSLYRTSYQTTKHSSKCRSWNIPAVPASSSQQIHDVLSSDVRPSPSGSQHSGFWRIQTPPQRDTLIFPRRRNFGSQAGNVNFVVYALYLSSRV